MTDISNTDDIIDSRDVIARIEELEAEREALADAVDETGAALDAALIAFVADGDDNAPAVTDAYQAHRDAKVDLEEWDGAAELASLQALAEEASGYAADWQYGEQLIRDSYFRDYAMELAEELATDETRDRSWPYTCIDWDQAARELQMDYTAVDFDGVTYWIR